ncbi:hypothetical protein PGQ11_003120 [Apiospora arundinis]|uniref:Uncharacterized protein n=1 Tax=Apiospora arundinis TaxID=335852 RepID=A0ABR2J4Y6_9PEZI
MPISTVLKAATILSLLFTAVSIWPSISAASDGRTSKLIAEWTARKDFIENCEAHNWSSAACERSKGIQLDAPPNLDRSRWKRHLETDNLLSLITSTGVIALHPLLWIPISSSLLFIQMRRLVIRGSSQRPESSPVHTDDLTPAQEFGFYSAPAHGETSFNSESDPDESKPTPITRDYNLRPRPPRKAQNPALERASKQEPPPKPRADRTRPSNGPRTESKETRKAQNPAPERTSKRKPAPKPKTEGTNFPNGPRTESKETSQKASGVSPGNPILIWYCCQCGGGPMNVATNIHCFCYYQHQRCSYCCVEYSTTRNRMSRNR